MAVYAGLGRGKTILLVEDSDVNRRMLKEILSLSESLVLEAENGHKALKVWREHKIDLIFMDLSMPEMSGLEATAIIREQENPDGRVPIVALTGNTAEGVEKKCRASGMDGCISKPYSPKLIIETLINFFPAQEKTEANEGEALFLPEQGLRRVRNNHDFYKKLLVDYFLELPEKISELKGAVDSSDYKKIEFFAHYIKGMSNNVGAVRLGKLCALIEESAINNCPIAELKRLCHQLGRIAEETMVKISDSGYHQT